MKKSLLLAVVLYLSSASPAVSSLFDFTEGDFGLLGDQNAIGPLNTDRRHVVNIYGSYALVRKAEGLVAASKD